MNDEAAFVAAIAADPGDTHLPLIFADWLDDHGDPRGQWIRSGYVHGWMRPDYQSPVPKLLDALKKDRRVIEVRRAAEVIGEPIVPGLVELLKHETSRVREQACFCLRRIGKRAKEAVPALLEAMSDESSAVREQAAKALKDIGTKDVAPTDNLKAALNDDNYSVRRMASKVLGSMGAKRDVLQELIERYESPLASDRFEVIEGLAELGTVDVVPVLDKALNDPESEVREKAVTALGRTKHADAAEPLFRAMRDASAKVRLAAARQLGRYSWQLPLNADAIEAVSELLGDPVEDVRAAACGTLAAAVGDLAPPVPRIIRLLDDLSDKVRRAAVSTLGDIGADSAPALRALIEELDDPNAEHRRDVVRAIGRIAPDDPAALAALLPLLRDPGPGVASAVTQLLSEWGALPASAIPPLLDRAAAARAADNDSELAAALGALGKVEAPTPAVLEALRAGVREPIGYGWARGSALQSLANLGPAALPALPDVLEVFQPGNENLYYQVPQAAARALLAMGPPGVAELERLIDGNEDARWRIVGAMRQREVGAAALPLLPAYLKLLDALSPNERHRGDLLDAIRAIGPGAAGAVPRLLAVLDGDADAYFTRNTLHALHGFVDALPPHLPKLVELSERPELTECLPWFAGLFAALAPGEAVREPLRALLHRSVAKMADGVPSYAHQQTRGACAAALVKYGDPALLPDLAPLATDPYAPNRRALVEYLPRFDSPLVVPLLRQLLADEDDDVRLAAVGPLAARADASDETVAALVRALEDRVPKVRRAAIDGLARLKVGSDAVLAALQAATEDADKQTAARAGVALRKLTPKEPKVKKSPAPANPRKEPPAAKGKKKPG